MRRHCQPGFTLLELLLAIGLSLLLSLLAYGGLHLALQSWDGVDRQLQKSERHYLTQRLLRRLLESPQEQHLRDIDGLMQLAFRGQPESLIFCAELPGLGQPGERYWLQLVQEPAQPLSVKAQHWRLLLRYRPWRESAVLDWPLLEESLSLDSESEVLLEDLPAPLRFSYLERRRDGEPQWREDWLEQTQMPLLLRIAADGQQQLELSVALRENSHDILAPP